MGLNIQVRNGSFADEVHTRKKNSNICIYEMLTKSTKWEQIS